MFAVQREEAEGKQVKMSKDAVAVTNMCRNRNGVGLMSEIE